MKKDKFLEQTAKDYGIGYEKVKWIHNKMDGDLFRFYKELESYIKEKLTI